jgi:hypothetical protein
VQAAAAAKPLLPQLGQGVVDRGAGHKAHVVQFDVAAVDTAAEHHQE